ncbi:hypothetical protein [Shimazuella kribbensis]|uniref:hypothetical protein n=1 Tax=Shimazuella kribbensis TaxID=139808 RepID=UPI00042696F1|nr:hypothetical protein [Shimazuella kribbensis]
MSWLQRFRQSYKDNKRLTALRAEMSKNNTTLNCFHELVIDHYKGEFGLAGLKRAFSLMSEADQRRYASDPTVPEEESKHYHAKLSHQR